MEKLFTSKHGGLTVYLFDATASIATTTRISTATPKCRKARPAQGEMIGYVGTTGNAPPNAPHLHFAMFKLGPEKHWWQGTALDPYLIWR